MQFSRTRLSDIVHRLACAVAPRTCRLSLHCAGPSHETSAAVSQRAEEGAAQGPISRTPEREGAPALEQESAPCARPPGLWHPSCGTSPCSRRLWPICSTTAPGHPCGAPSTTPTSESPGPCPGLGRHDGAARGPGTCLYPAPVLTSRGRGWASAWREAWSPHGRPCGRPHHGVFRPAVATRGFSHRSPVMDGYGAAHQGGCSRLPRGVAGLGEGAVVGSRMDEAGPRWRSSGA